MYLKDVLKEFKSRKIKLFVDMDGVIVDYVFGNPGEFHKKRPLYDSINKIKIVSEMPNVELFILSATRKTEGIEQKNWWLDTYAPFFKKENRIILSREANDMTESAVLKAEFMKEYKRDDSVIVIIDDDPKNLKAIKKLNEDVVLLKDTVLVD